MKPNSYGKPELRNARRAGGKLLSAVFLFSVFVNILMLTGPLFMLQVYDRVLSSRSQETLTALFILVAALYAFLGLLDFARGRTLNRFAARFQASLDDRVFAASMKPAAPMGRNTLPNNGLRDLDAVQKLLSSPAMLSLFDIPWSPLFIATIFIFHPMLGWMAVAGTGVLILVTLLNNVLTRDRSRDAMKATTQAQAFAHKAREYGDLIRAQGMGGSIASRWHDLHDRAQEQNITASDWTGVFTAFTKSFRLFLQSAMLAVGAFFVLRGEMTGGAMIAGSILLGRALAPIEQTLGRWPLIQAAIAGWHSLANFLAATPPDQVSLDLPRPEAQISCKNASMFSPGTKQAILQQISFDVTPGEIVGVIGKSGAGKSTLAKVLLGLNHLSAGEVRLGGAKLDQYDPRKLGYYFGYLPQDVTLFDGTVAENIARMAVNLDSEKVISAAQRANAHEFILALPNGYETAISSGTTNISGGQRQRIALARALYGDPVVLVLDEPNSALDADGSAALNRAMQEFKNSGRSVIIMTHRPMALSECDRLVVMDHGRIRTQGPRDDILKEMMRNSGDVKRLASVETGT
jgi:PrtD family type I secretion system ABC transporter